jgi:signal transduction histidine kinase
MPIRGLRAEAYSEGKVVYDNNFPDSKWTRLMPEGHVMLKNVLFAPLIIDKKTLGVIGLANKSDKFNEHDAEMAMAFASIAAVALINSQVLETLEALVEERTKQLKDSERLAAIGQTAGMVGHDIRNPLQAIIGDIYLAKSDVASLQKSEKKESLQESLEAIAKNAEYINKIVTDLQDFAKPLSPCLEETDLKLLIEDLLRKDGIPKNVKTELKLDSNAHMVTADNAYIRRIVGNLVSNAIQAMPDGGKLKIRATRQANDILITVEDTGVGIPEEAKSKLFKPLFTTKSRGQGFGLAVVKRLTEALNGTVNFESESGKGTKFTIRLSSTKDKN